MKNFATIIYAEVKKQNRDLFHSSVVWFSLLLWPILDFIQVYYSFKPFNLNNSQNVVMINSKQSLIIFLITGFLGFTCFWSMVQSAWQMSHERSNGTLETVFLSPANRLAILYGRALGALISDIWMFALFSIFIILTNKAVSLKVIYSLPIAFFILIISSTIWGGMMNAIFIFSRDATFLYYIFNAPMEIFSGVRIPISSFPIWAKIISCIFPLTYCLVFIRDLLNPNVLTINIRNLLLMIIILVIIIAITKVILNLAEKNARKTGNLNFY